MSIIVKSRRRTRSPTPRAESELSKTFGARLRALRKQQKVRLVELATASGVDAATISRIETGKMTGTLESHLRLARALGVRLAQLYAEVEEAQVRQSISLQPASGRTEVYVHEAGKSSVAILTTEVLKKKLMPVLITLEPGGRTQQEEARVGTEKFLYVLDGDVEARIGHDMRRLRKGSTLYFDASLPHALRNPGAKPARCLAVTTPPAL